MMVAVQEPDSVVDLANKQREYIDFVLNGNTDAHGGSRPPRTDRDQRGHNEPGAWGGRGQQRMAHAVSPLPPAPLLQRA
jgi:hypothetical protein